jgi:hypothetical protein
LSGVGGQNHPVAPRQYTEPASHRTGFVDVIDNHCAIQPPNGPFVTSAHQRADDAQLRRKATLTANADTPTFAEVGSRPVANVPGGTCSDLPGHYDNSQRAASVCFVETMACPWGTEKRDTKMRTRLITGLAVLMMLLPVSAFGDEHVDLEELCYTDPTNDLCVDEPDVTEPEVTEPEVTEPEEEIVTVVAERPTTPLAVTGSDLLVLALLAAVLLGSGALLVTFTRRRSRRSVEG